MMMVVVRMEVKVAGLILWWACILGGHCSSSPFFSNFKAMKTLLSCPFLEERDTDFYAYKIPVFILLVANTFFLFWIMLVCINRFIVIAINGVQIVISKLHFQTAMDVDRRHYRAAKALVIVVPVLGITYILTLLGPSARDTPTAYAIFQAVRAALLSTQGALITMPYCYFNTEVQSSLTNHWERWKMIRTLDSECQSRKTSLATHSLHGEVNVFTCVRC